MADKGIRPYTNAKFIELARTAQFGDRKANAAFRANIIADVCEQFGISHASGATAYNNAFIEARKIPEVADLLQGLGRPEDKKGGRKPKAKPTDTAVAEDNAVVNRDAEYVEEQQTVFTVKKKSDGTVVAEGLSFEDAKSLVARAAAAKKAKLYWV